MKKALILIALTLSASAFAQVTHSALPTTPQHDAARVEIIRQHVVLAEQERMALLQKEQVCVHSAGDTQAIKHCVKETHDGQDAFHAQHRAERQQHRAEHAVNK